MTLRVNCAETREHKLKHVHRAVNLTKKKAEELLTSSNEFCYSMGLQHNIVERNGIKKNYGEGGYSVAMRVNIVGKIQFPRARFQKKNMLVRSPLEFWQIHPEMIR